MPFDRSRLDRPAMQTGRSSSSPRRGRKCRADRVRAPGARHQKWPRARTHLDLVRFRLNKMVVQASSNERKKNTCTTRHSPDRAVEYEAAPHFPATRTRTALSIAQLVCVLVSPAGLGFRLGLYRTWTSGICTSGCAAGYCALHGCRSYFSRALTSDYYPLPGPWLRFPRTAWKREGQEVGLGKRQNP
jgi:hypothetical protein